MTASVKCPSCGCADLDLRRYFSMMVLSDTQALFSLHCDHCNKIVSLVETIPPSLYDDVRSAAAEVNAGMGQHT